MSSSSVNEKLEKILRDEQPKANYSMAMFMLLLSLVLGFLWFFFIIGFFKPDRLAFHICFPVCVGLSLISSLIGIRKKGRGDHLPALYFTVLEVIITLFNLLIGNRFVYAYVLPTFLTFFYHDRKMNRQMAALNTFFILFLGFANAFLYPYTGIIDLNAVEYSKSVTLETQNYLYRAALAAGPDPLLTLRNTLLMSLSVPLVVNLLLYGIGNYYLRREEKRLLLLEELYEKENEMEKEVMSAREKLMLSQIRPHFLYNTLSSIMGIEGMPYEARKALSSFSRYLRGNMKVLSSDPVIPLTQELAHVRNFTDLEILRFGDEIRVDYDIEDSDFSVPTLSVQVLTENAVRHGLADKEGGGRVLISSFSVPGGHCLVVEDDGNGFDPDQTVDEKEHIGLANLRIRLEALLGGSLRIESSPGSGARVTMLIPDHKETSGREESEDEGTDSGS